MCRGDFAIGIVVRSYHRETCPWAKLQTAENVTKSSRARLGHARARPSAAHARAPRRRASNTDSSSMCRGDFAISIVVRPCHRHACTWVKLETARNVTNSSRARLSRTRARPSAARARAPHGRASHADPSSTCRADLAIGIDVLPYHRHSCPWATLRTPQNVTNSSWARLGRARAAHPELGAVGPALPCLPALPSCLASCHRYTCPPCLPSCLPSCHAFLPSFLPSFRPLFPAVTTQRVVERHPLRLSFPAGAWKYQVWAMPRTRGRVTSRVRVDS